MWWRRRLGHGWMLLYFLHFDGCVCSWDEKNECIGWHVDGWYLQLGAFSEHMDGWYHTNFAFFIGALVNGWKRRVHWMDNIMSLLQFSRARLLIGWKRCVNWMDDILSLIDFTRPASMLRFREYWGFIILMILIIPLAVNKSKSISKKCKVFLVSHSINEVIIK